MRARIICLSVLLFVLSSAFAVFAADNRFIPIEKGYSFIFTANDSNPETPAWSENITVSGMTAIPPSLLYYSVDQLSGGEYQMIGIRSTVSDVRQYVGFGKEQIIWKKGAVGTKWTYKERNGNIIERKIEAIEDVTVPAGTFADCLKFHNRCTNCSGVSDWYEWVKPGFMMVKWIDYWAENAPVIYRLKTVTTP